jgi:hypothetical protein
MLEDSIISNWLETPCYGVETETLEVGLFGGGSMILADLCRWQSIIQISNHVFFSPRLHQYLLSHL